MKIYANLYMNDSICDEKDRIIEGLQKRKILFNKYLIILSRSEKNHLEIFSAALLQQKKISAENLFLVGIGDGYDGALELVQRITDEVLEATGNVNIRAYLSERQEMYEKENV